MTVQIKEELYQEIKEFCTLNKLKINQFVNDLLQKSFMIEKYGDSPFTNFAKKIIENTEEVPEEIQQVINDHFDEMLSDKEIESVPVEDYNFSVKKEEVNECEMDKPVGLPSWDTNPMPDWNIEPIHTTKEQTKPKKRKLK